MIYYLWKYRLLKGRHIKTIFKYINHDILEKWSPKDQINLFPKGIEHHANLNFIKSAKERLSIMHKGEITPSVTGNKDTKIPALRVHDLA